MGRVTVDNVKDVVRFHKADADQIEKYENLACCAETLIESILKNAPECADRSEAIRCARMAKMWASSAIALNGAI